MDGFFKKLGEKLKIPEGSMKKSLSENQKAFEDNQKKMIKVMDEIAVLVQREKEGEDVARLIRDKGRERDQLAIEQEGIISNGVI